MKPPFLRLIESSRGSDEALIFVNGYLSEDMSSSEDNAYWWWNFRLAGWKGSIYYLWWDASHLKTFLQWFAIGGLGAVLHWEKHENRSKRVGTIYLPNLIEDIPETSVTLVGFSLGSRIIYYTLKQFSLYPYSKKINNVVFMAGAVRRGASKNWVQVANGLRGKIINIFNEDDWVLRVLFKSVSLNRSACGAKPIMEFHPRIININATSLLRSSNHSGFDYASLLPRILPHYF